MIDGPPNLNKPSNAIIIEGFDRVNNNNNIGSGNHNSVLGGNSRLIIDFSNNKVHPGNSKNTSFMVNTPQT